jgi:hypothetical protein
MPDGLHIPRVVRFLIAGIVIEAALFALARFDPAFASLIFGAYFGVALIIGLAIWRERRRSGEDRRQSDDRRQV